MSAPYSADLILGNARVITMEADKPVARLVAIVGDRIAWVGDMDDPSRLQGRHSRVLDCQGLTLVPGFIDAHCHLLALAASLQGVDCRPEAAGSLGQIVKAIHRHALETPQERWIRAFGYDEFYLEEQRHPTRWELDAAAPNHPVRLEHRTGHACVLNSLALSLLGISRDTPDPPHGVIQRDEATGEPTGLLLEMNEEVSEGMGAHRREEELLQGVREASQLLLSVGVTSIQDASPGNSLQRWQAFQKLKEGGHLVPRVTMMVGASHLGAFLDAGLRPGWGDKNLRLGAVKVMLTLTTGTLQPPREELCQVVLQAHRARFPVAIHAVEQEAVEAAVEALLKARGLLPRPGARHRIEHCSECPPALQEKVKASDALVVTQPGYIYYNGDRYLAQVEPGLIPHLYPVGSLVRAGVTVAGGSDAPVAPPNPLMGIYAAATRRTRGGQILSSQQAVSAAQALRMHTLAAAYASFQEELVGSIRPGKLADLVLLKDDPTTVEPEGIREIGVAMTLVGGRTAWEA